MIIATNNETPPKNLAIRWRKTALALFVLAAFFGFTLFVFVSGGLAYKNGTMATVKAFFTQPAETAYHYINGSMQKMDVVDLHIKHDHFQYISFARENALTNERHATSLWQYVPAIITTPTDEYKVKVKLKGTGPDHWAHPQKWSFKVSVKNDSAINGMKKFSFMHPRARSYIYDWVYQQYLKDQGFIYRRSEYVQLRVNGQDLGVYVMEEDFDKQLIENNQRREGPIVAFSKETLVSEWVRTKSFDIGDATFTSANVVETIDIKGPTAERAISLLEGFREGRLKVSETFNLEEIAHFVAARALFKSLEFDNNDVRFYHNPVTSKLEPIGGEIHFDDYGGTEKMNSWWLFEEQGRSREFHRLFFKDPEFLESYFRHLDHITQPEHLNAFLKRINRPLSKQLSKLHREFPWMKFGRDTLVQNSEFIQTVLEPINAVNAYVSYEQTEKVSLKIANTQFWPVEIIGLSHNGTFWPISSKNRILQSKSDKERPIYSDFTFNWTSQQREELKQSLHEEYEVIYSIIGSDRRGSTLANNWKRYDESLFQKDYSDTSDIHSIAFLGVNEETKTIQFKPGAWTIDSDLIIPAGYTVQAGSNTRYDITNGASIFIYSPITFVGTKDSPLIFESTDSKGKGIAVINAPTPCRVKHVHFKNLNNPDLQGWSLTSSVTFYQCELEMSETTISDCRSEDSLNIIRSTFKLKDCLIQNAFSDALDIDFSNGFLDKMTFQNSGNDALDASGSLVSASNILIDTVGDKAISGGEASNILGADIIIRNSPLGVVSKDKSSVSIEKLLLESCEIGFTAYQKKPEFGSAEITATNAITSDVAIPFLIEIGSQMTYNQEYIMPNDSDTKSKMYGVEFGKSSK
jgi:hypothetical protein